VKSNPRRFAEGTEVPIHRSKAQIDEILYAQGCESIRWTQDRDGSVTLEFVWRREAAELYCARFKVRAATDEEIRVECRQKRSGSFLHERYQRLSERRGWRELRVLHLWLKACFESVGGGIVEPEQVFLPWIVTASGQTVSEELVPRLPELVARGGIGLLLPAQHEIVVQP